MSGATCGPCTLGTLLWTSGRYSDCTVVVESSVCPPEGPAPAPSTATAPHASAPAAAAASAPEQAKQVSSATQQRARKSLKLHRLLLEQCVYFKAMFSERWTHESSTLEAPVTLEVDGESAEAVEHVLRLMYTKDWGAAFGGVASVVSVYRVASFLVWEEALRECTARMIALLSRETFREILEHAEALGWSEVIEYCTTYTHATDSNIFTEANLARLLDMALQQNSKEAQTLCETEFRENERLGRSDVTRAVLLRRVNEASLVVGNNLVPGVTWFQAQLLAWLDVPVLLKTWTAFKVALSRLSNQLALFALALMERCSAEEGRCLERAAAPLSVDEAHEILAVWSPYIQNASGQLFGAAILRYAHGLLARGRMDIDELERIVRKHLSSGFPVRCGPETVQALVRILTTIDSRHRGALVNAVVGSFHHSASSLVAFGPDLLAAIVWCQEEEKGRSKKPGPAPGPAGPSPSDSPAPAPAPAADDEQST